MASLVETLASYVPGLVVRRLLQNPAPQQAPEAESFPAAVLFADISGFTALADRLAQSDPEGVQHGTEALTHLLNSYFGELVNSILAHGGDVAEFAGDALLALWRDERSAKTTSAQLLPSAIARAAQCALDIQARLNDYPVAEDVRLSVRIGLSLGEVKVLHVGGVFGRWKLLVSGGPVEEATLAEQHAQPGQIMLAPVAWPALRPLSLAQPGPENHVQLTALCVAPYVRPYRAPHPTSECETALRAYLPGAVVARLVPGQHPQRESSQAEWLAELRRVTVLFVNLPQITAASSLEQIHRVVCQIQTTIYRYEGSINKFSLGPRGAVLVAATGLPPLAHEDDPSRGLYAALALQTDLQRLLGQPCAIGVTTDRAFCGSIGSFVRREYTMIGHSINLAARLMQSAATHLAQHTFGNETSLTLCDAVTQVAAHNRFTFENLPSITVKGKTQPVPIYRPLPQPPRKLSPTQILKLRNQLIGRQPERMVLAERLQALLRGQAGGVVIIEGEAGIGKTRLMEELRRQAEAMRLKTYTVTGDAFEKSTPYRVWRPVFSQLLDLDVLSDPVARRQHILSLLELWPELDLLRLAPLLNVVLPLDLPDNADTQHLTGQARADATRLLLQQIWTALVSSSPKVIVMEDAHWLDSASWGLLPALNQLACSGPLLLVLVLRPFRSEHMPLADPPPNEYLVLRQSSCIHWLHLEPLSVSDTLLLVRERLGVASLPAPVSNLILERAEGNPFVSEALAYALRDNGLITCSEGECRLTGSAEDFQMVQLPETVQGLLISRIDRLPAEWQLTLKTASVIGREFPVAVLEQVFPAPEAVAQLSEYLVALERQGLLEKVLPTAEPAYAFKQATVQAVVYDLMLFAQRRELHLLIGLALETHYQDRRSEIYGVLAQHFFHGELWDKALAYYLAAGDAAARLNAHVEAQGYYGGALESLGHLPATPTHQRQQVELALKHVSVSWGSEPLERNLTRLSEAELLAQKLINDGATNLRVPLARVHFWRGRLHLYRNASPLAIRQFQQVLTAMRTVGDRDLLSLFHSAIAQALLVQGRFPQANPLLNEAVRLLEQTENRLEFIRTLGYWGVGLAATGREAVALGAVQRALTHAQEMNTLMGESISYINLSLVHLFSHRWLLMAEAARHASETAEATGNEIYQYWSLGLLGWAQGHLGDQLTAFGTLRAAEALRRRLGGELLFSDWFECARAELLLKNGQARDALTIARHALENATAAEGVFAAGLAHRLCGQALSTVRETGWYEQAEQHFIESIQLLTTSEAALELRHTNTLLTNLQQPAKSTAPTKPLEPLPGG